MIREEVRRVVDNLLIQIAPEVDPRALDPGENLRAQVDLDSIDYLNFMIAMGQKFGVEIRETDFARMVSLDRIVEFVSEKSRTAGSAR